MSEAFESLFGQPSGSEVVSEVQAEAPPVEQAPEGPARGPDGKFISAASDAPPVAETPPAATVEATPPQSQEAPPLAALLDERDKRKAAQAERDALAKELADLRARSAEPLAPEEQQQAEIHTLRQQTQRLSVEVEHGRQAVQAAYDWAVARCDTDKVFNAEMAAKIGLIGNPYQVAVEAHKQHAELEEFNAWRATRNNPPPAAPDPTPSPQLTPAPPVPRSLANAPGNGAAGAPHIPVGPGQAFAAVIPR